MNVNVEPGFKFMKLWEAYPKTISEVREACKDRGTTPQNKCALKMSYALQKAKMFTPKHWDGISHFYQSRNLGGYCQSNSLLKAAGIRHLFLGAEPLANLIDNLYFTRRSRAGILERGRKQT